MILAIETSCDETAAAVIEDGRRIRSNVVASQIELHRPYGGVFPEIASRQHVFDIVPVIERALADAARGVGRPDGAGGDARARGWPARCWWASTRPRRSPGRAGCPWSPSTTWRATSTPTGWTRAARSHPAAITRPSLPELDAAGRAFPLLVLIVSGGHTELILMQGHGRYQRLGATLDDAAGEAFDKVARLLGLSYPGGPAIQQAAEGGNPAAFDFPRALTNYAIQPEHRFNFSFSGLKTAVLRQVRELGDDPATCPVADLAASFQAAVVDVLVAKTARRRAGITA